MDFYADLIRIIGKFQSLCEKDFKYCRCGLEKKLLAMSPYLLTEVRQYLRFLFRMEPLYFFISFEPSHLFTRINAGVLLDFIYGKGEFPFSIQILEQFFITYCVERIEVAIGKYRAYFFQ